MTNPIRRTEVIGEPTNICVECGKGYWVKPYRRANSKFCSFECGGRHRARLSLNNGQKPWAVGNKWRAGKRPSNAFRPEQVRGESNPRWRDGLSLRCAHCGVEFRQKPWLASQNGTAKYCGRPCFQASGCFQGERSPTYVGGPTTYRGRGWPKARAAIVEKQNGDCARCGKHVGCSLPVHHIKPFRDFDTAEEANQPENLIGLCQSCHMKEEATARKGAAYAQPDMFIEQPKREDPKQEALL